MYIIFFRKFSTCNYLFLLCSSRFRWKSRDGRRSGTEQRSRLDILNQKFRLYFTTREKNYTLKIKNLYIITDKIEYMVVSLQLSRYPCRSNIPWHRARTSQRVEQTFWCCRCWVHWFVFTVSITRHSVTDFKQYVVQEIRKEYKLNGIRVVVIFMNEKKTTTSNFVDIIEKLSITSPIEIMVVKKSVLSK